MLGQNSYGQLGDGTTTERHTPVAVSGLSNAVAIAAGDCHTCALLSDGTARCWGDNDYGQLGDGTTDGPPHPGGRLRPDATPSPSPPGTTTPAPCSATAPPGAGAENGYGQLGDGTTTEQPHPGGRLRPGVARSPAIAAGDYHTCALLSDGSARCWGNNSYGQLGDGTMTERHTPVAVSGLSNAVAIAAGDMPHLRRAQRRHRPVLGRQRSGQLGDDTTTSATPRWPSPA